jgi:hypothetical protein
MLRAQKRVKLEIKTRRTVSRHCITTYQKAVPDLTACEAQAAAVAAGTL